VNTDNAMRGEIKQMWVMYWQQEYRDIRSEPITLGLALSLTHRIRHRTSVSHEP